VSRLTCALQGAAPGSAGVCRRPERNNGPATQPDDLGPPRWSGWPNLRWSLRKKLSARVDLLPRGGDLRPKQIRVSPYLPDNFFRLFAGAAVIVVHDDSRLPPESSLVFETSAITQDKAGQNYGGLTRVRGRKLRWLAAAESGLTSAPLLSHPAHTECGSMSDERTSSGPRLAHSAT